MSAGSSSLRRRRERLRSQSRVEFEVRDLCEGVDAGVGPARPVELRSSRRPATSRMARSIPPCTVRAFFWICQPL